MLTCDSDPHHVPPKTPSRRATPTHYRTPPLLSLLDRKADEVFCEDGKADVIGEDDFPPKVVRRLFLVGARGIELGQEEACLRSGRAEGGCWVALCFSKGDVFGISGGSVNFAKPWHGLRYESKS